MSDLVSRLIVAAREFTLNVSVDAANREKEAEDALRAELAAARAEVERRKPIPVSEKMPDTHIYVLMFDGFTELWTIGYLVKLSENIYQWTTIDGDFYHGNNFPRVTHWMPLPENPNDETPEA